MNKTPHELSGAETYSEDYVLFKKLGFDTFKVNHQQEMCVGKYKLSGYNQAKVKVYVTCIPAQTWRFEIDTEEDHYYEIETGTGTLTYYWDTILKIAKGLIEVTEIRQK